MEAGTYCLVMVSMSLEKVSYLIHSGKKLTRRRSVMIEDLPTNSTKSSRRKEGSSGTGVPGGWGSSSMAADDVDFETSARKASKAELSLNREEGGC